MTSSTYRNKKSYSVVRVTLPLSLSITALLMVIVVMMIIRMAIEGIMLY